MRIKIFLIATMRRGEVTGRWSNPVCGHGEEGQGRKNRAEVSLVGMSSIHVWGKYRKKTTNRGDGGGILTVPAQWKRGNLKGAGGP